MLSGYVYEGLTALGEPPIAEVLITVRDAFGVDITVMSDRSGFYSVRAPMGRVVVTAAKPGYETREAQFEVAASIVLNFSLRPIRSD
jgi:Carboxypeptidase regulatory-like domain